MTPNPSNVRMRLRALAIAVKNNATEERCTMLTERLRAAALHGGTRDLDAAM